MRRSPGGVTRTDRRRANPAAIACWKQRARGPDQRGTDSRRTAPCLSERAQLRSGFTVAAVYDRRVLLPCSPRHSQSAATELARTIRGHSFRSRKALQRVYSRIGQVSPPKKDRKSHSESRQPLLRSRSVGREI